MRRPMLFIAVCFLIGLLTGHYLTISPVWIGIGLTAGLFIGCGLYRFGNITAWYVIPAGICIVLSGVIWQIVRTQIITADDIRRFCDRATPVIIYGTIVRDPDLRERQTLITVHSDSVQIDEKRPPTPVSGRLLVRLERGIESGEYGDHIRVAGFLRSPQPARNPGGFDARTYYSGRGIYGLMRIRNPGDYRLTARRRTSDLYTVLIRPIKRSITATIDGTLNGRSAALLKGILLGQRQQLPEDLLTSFTTIGLTHILAVSGLHVGLITLITITFFIILRVPGAAADAATIGVLILYALITDLTPSVVRASIMAGLFLIGRRLNRRTDAVNILATAALIILIIWPTALFDLSFQLSFIATLAIITGYPRFKALLPARSADSEVWWVRWVRDGIIVSLAAQLGTAPLAAAVFNQVSWVAAAANLIIGPLVFLATTLGVLTALTGPLFFGFARLFGAANAFVLHSMIYLAELFSRIPAALLAVPAPSHIVMASYYFLFLLFIWRPSDRIWKRTRLGAAGIAVVLLGWHLYGPSQLLEITVLDVGQGDAIFIVCPNGRKILIDGGHLTPNYDAGARVVVPFLRAEGHRHIDIMMVSHPHADHYGGLISVLDAVSVGEIAASGRTSQSASYKAWRATIEKRGIRYRTVAAGDTLAGLGRVRGVILHPSRDEAGGDAVHSVNDASVVLHLGYEAFRMLFTGDIEQAAEEALLRRYTDIKSTIVKAPHHGSVTSSSSSFVKAAAPEAAVISVGLHNRFQHPSSQVIGRYRRIGASVYRTDASGAVIIRSDGQTWWIAPYAAPPPIRYYPRQNPASIPLTAPPKGSIFR